MVPVQQLDPAMAVVMPRVAVRIPSHITRIVTVAARAAIAAAIVERSPVERTARKWPKRKNSCPDVVGTGGRPGPALLEWIITIDVRRCWRLSA